VTSGPTEVLAALAEAAGREPVIALIGATARNAWAPPRATTDVDVAIAADSRVLEAVLRALRGLGYEPVRIHRADPEDDLADLVVCRAAAGTPRQVDLLVAKTPFEAEVLRRARPVEIAGVEIAVATPEDLIVYKSIADRPRDREDIEVIRRTQTRAGRALDRAYIERWARFWGISDRVAALWKEEDER